MSGDPIKRSQYIRITDRDETRTVDVNSKDELIVEDVAQSATSTLKTITDTATIARVGASNKAGRKALEFQPLDGTLLWGYESSCPFRLNEGDFISIEIGDAADVYYKADDDDVEVAVGEK